MLRACTEGNPAKSSRVGAEDKFRFTLLPCTTSSSTCTRACTYKRTYVPVYRTVSQRRNRRGSFRATPARTWRGQPAGRLSLSLSPPFPLFLPQRSLSLSLSGVSGSVYRSYRAEASNDVDGHHAEYIFAPGVIEARSARVGGTIHTGI